MTTYCDLCHDETRNRKRTGKRNELLCTDCRYWTAYYDSLTPEGWAEEQRMIEEYDADHAGDPL
jgi:hypothetical protein